MKRKQLGEELHYFLCWIVELNENHVTAAAAAAAAVPSPAVPVAVVAAAV